MRDDDIPDMVQQDICDLGIVGLNIVEEKRLGSNAQLAAPLYEQLQPLDFGRCRLVIAVPESFQWESCRSLEGLRIATTYPNILGGWLRRTGVSADVVPLSGAVEIAPRLGRADVICD